MMGMFKPAVKEAAKLRLSIAGPSGSGKTYTGLAIASALADDKPIALVDTEHGSASKYADLFAFDVAEMHPPFHPDKFVAAITEAANAGYAVVILDSLTHAWSGTGGMLDIIDEIAKRMRNPNSFAAWKDGTPIQNRLIDGIVGAPIHVIATMRSKQEYVLQDSGNGRQTPKKVGMAAQQREGFEYEFDVAFDMDIDNNAIVSKTRCPALTGRVFNKPGADVAGILAGWLKGAAPSTSKAQTNGGAVQSPTVSVVEQPINLRSNSISDNGHGTGNGTGASPLPPGVPSFVADWQNVDDAFAWAIQVGACRDTYHARGSMKKVIDGQFSGKFTNVNRLAVFAAFWQRQTDKLNGIVPADNPFVDEAEAVPA